MNRQENQEEVLAVDPRLREDDIQLMKIFPLVEGQLRQSSELHSRDESWNNGGLYSVFFSFTVEKLLSIIYSRYIICFQK